MKAPAVADDTQVVAETPADDASKWIAVSAAATLHAIVNTCKSIFTMILSQYSGKVVEKINITESMNKLTTTLDYLTKQLGTMKTKSEVYRTEAKKLYSAGNMTGALYQMRLHKMYTLEMRKIESLQFNIESTILRIDSLNIVIDTVSALKESSDQFQIVQRGIDIDKLEETIDDVCEQQDASSTIENILSDMSRINPNDFTYTEEEMIQELSSLEDTEEEHQDSGQHPPGISGQQQQEKETNIMLSSMPIAPDHSPEEVKNLGGEVSRQVEQI